VISIRAMIHGLMLIYRVLDGDEMAGQIEFV
jgi:hypothetical protein